LAPQADRASVPVVKDAVLLRAGPRGVGPVDMHTLVVVGSSRTRVQGGRMVTPRDYRWAPLEVRT